MCRGIPVSVTETLEQGLGPAGVFTDAVQRVSVGKCIMHRDHGLPLVAVLWVFVLFLPPLLSVAPHGLVPVPGFFGVSLLCLSLPGCNGGLTNAISHLPEDSE